ncbi:hypothetical protein BS78_07G144900 [Paspalum vaginatum]|nr:hypothetical protein BS78_07G144900 [Paspalum vaginatum]
MAASGLAGASGAARPLMRLVTMRGVPILRQLLLDERLLRRSADNWFLINDGTTPPTIVMGMSGRVSELVEIHPGTVFVTFICNNSAVPGLLPFPRNIMEWSGQLYSKNGMVNQHQGHRKFGGNAQSITKKPRWVHHTSFLWDYDRAPEYRLEPHRFLVPHEGVMPSRSVFTDGVITALGDHFSVESTDLETVLSNDEEFVPTTKLLSQEDLEEIVSSKESISVVYRKLKHYHDHNEETLIAAVKSESNYWRAVGLFRLQVT